MDVVGGEWKSCWRRTVQAVRRREYTPRALVRKSLAKVLSDGSPAPFPYHRDSMMIALGILLALAGGVWLAQGLNLPFAPGSFRTADPLWAAIGAITLASGLAILVRALLEWRRNRGEDDLEGRLD